MVDGEFVAAAPYSAADAAVLVQLAEAAAGDLSAGAVLPPGWSPLATVPANPPAPPAAMGAQAIYATGNLPSDPATTVVVLAVGMPWITYLNAFSDGVLDIVPVPFGVPSTGKIVPTFAQLYGQLRGGLWAALTQAGKNPIVVTGIGLGAPLAQLAALDLTPPNVGPKKELPAAAPSCYAFSTPAFGDAVFAGDLARVVASSWTVTPAYLNQNLDLFASVPSGGDVTLSGTPQQVATQFPTPFDDPWIERSPWFYADALGQPFTPPPSSPTTISPQGTAFQPVLASALSQLCAVTYGLAQNPALAQRQPLTSYTYVGPLAATGSAVGATFSFAGGLAVAFRGAITFAEFGGLLASSNLAHAKFIANSAYVHAGALAMYAPLRNALLAQLNALPAGSQIVFTGHDLGGALAIIAAADVIKNAPTLTKPVVYTFGAAPVAGPTFPALVATATIFAVARPNDFLPQSMLMGGFVQLGTTMTLGGTPAQDEPGAHSATGYATLFDPRST
ncbi:MAG: lipase [Candidatus Eremiobacteraeota bacterium]|nr:lipase [Candidatus Eremiobacteraeota bacterium]